MAARRAKRRRRTMPLLSPRPSLTRGGGMGAEYYYDLCPFSLYVLQTQLLTQPGLQHSSPNTHPHRHPLARTLARAHRHPILGEGNTTTTACARKVVWAFTPPAPCTSAACIKIMPCRAALSATASMRARATALNSISLPPLVFPVSSPGTGPTQPLRQVQH